MPSLIMTGRLFSDGDKPLAGHTIRIEVFAATTGRWGQIAKTQTDSNGRFSAKLNTTSTGMGKAAPALRLLEEGNPARVLSPGPILSLNRTSKDITADFGEIERLDDEAFQRMTNSGKPSDTVAGLARKPGLNQGVVLHNLAADGALSASLAGRRFVATETMVATGTATSANVSVVGNDKLAAELLTLRRVSVERAVELTDKERQLATREHELNLTKTENQRLTTELEIAQAHAQEIEAALAKAKAAQKGEETEIDSVFANIGSKLSAADQTLKARAVPYRVGAIKVDLKGSMRGDGKIFLGGDKPDGSGVSVEMKPDRADGDTLQQVTVPDVTGLTQSAAVRVLRSVGLRLTPATQPVPAGKAPHGQSIRQSPDAGDKTPHGSTVLVVFATVTTQ